MDPDSARGLDELRTTLDATHGRLTINLPEEGTAVGHHAFTPAPLPDVLTPGQAAELLQVSERELLELAEAGSPPGRRIGVSWRFSRPALIK